MSKTRKFNRISLRLAWESSRNFATPPNVSLWNYVRGRNKEISHWWGINTQFWFVLFLGFVSREGNLLQPIRSTTQIWVGSLTGWRKNIGNHVKSLSTPAGCHSCRLFPFLFYWLWWWLCDDDEFYGACLMAGMSMPEISVPSSGRNKLPQTYFLKK